MALSHCTLAVFGAVIAGLMIGCSHLPSDPTVPEELPRKIASPRYDEGAVALTGPSSGKASWYNPRLKGHRTASGERYDPRAFTAAHRTLAFGTRVRVRCRATGKSVEVRVNDRGPASRARIIDVSYAAANALGILNRGVATVEIEVLSAGDSRAT